MRYNFSKDIPPALGYIRVSGKAQGDGDGPTRQRAAILNFAAQQGFPEPKCYSDIGVSGTIEGLHRPAFEKMLTEATLNESTTIIVERLDRLARDLIVSEIMMRELRTRGLKLFAVDQGAVDLATNDVDPSRKLIRQILSAVSEYEKSALVLKLRGSRERMRRETGRCEGRKPYGKNKNEIIILQMIDNMRRGSGASWWSIARALTVAGMRKRNGNIRWTGPEVSDLWETYHKRIAWVAGNGGVQTKEI